ncbi:metallophosphoesterase family protein [Polaromonas naphthalenivorans]|uniref:Metallophosphoesterase n=1 Tax=Polaromonas naphthalenivorans (strain CJ2) TaxID=365044 RepID=A1VMU8_POLNA|nr:DNA repair exonuclease [Polaromonas naphthalenivorans]ABM36976.1 metallophosphoesterase [Polaromonas naphthalenivorans CJ2]
MRFIHTADLHIDSPLRGLSRYQGAPLERLRSATRRALERLVELAVDEKVDFVLMAGDLYDRDWQDFHTGLFVNAQLVTLKNAGIQVFIVQGNHDAQSHMTRQIPWPDNVKVFSSRTAETAHLKALGVAIHGHSFPNREVPENLVPGYPPALPGCFNIGLLHTSLTGTDGHDTYAPATLSDLKAKGYDYWALGHVHARQVVCEAPRVVFPGNLQGRHARETGPKGCELVTVEGTAITARFVPLDVVRWHQVEIDMQPVLQLDDLRRQVVQALQSAVADAGEVLHAMRVVLTGQTPLQALEASQPGTLEAAVQAAAQEVAGADVWIEQVKLRLRSPLDRERIGQGGDALGELVRWVDELSSDGPALETFCREALTEVLGKLPAEVQAALAHELAESDIPRLDDAAALLALVKDAEATLLARLNVPEERSAA